VRVKVFDVLMFSIFIFFFQYFFLFIERSFTIDRDITMMRYIELFVKDVSYIINTVQIISSEFR